MAFIEWKKCLKEPNQLIKLIVLVIFVCITAYQAWFHQNSTVFKNTNRVVVLTEVLTRHHEYHCYECKILSESIGKILSPPVSTYYKFRLNDSIQYPSVTICRRPAYKSNLFPDFGIKATTQLSSDKSFQNFPFDKQTIADFLKHTTYSQKEMIPIYGYGGTGSIASTGYDNVEIKSTYFLNKGVCHTFIPKVNSDVFAMSGGYYLYVRHTVMQKDKLKDDKTGFSTSGFDVYIHGENEILTGEDDQENSLMETLYLESSEDMNVNLKLQTFSQLSSKDDPCIADLGYSKSKCEESCIHHQMAKGVNCTLPWLRIDTSEFRQCSDYQSVNKLIATLNSDRKNFLKHCTHCKISCNLTIYSSQILSRKEAEAFVQPGGSINLYFSSNLITQMEEVISYDWNIFLSDVGASLGFLLGLSVIGIAAILEEAIRWAFKSCAKKNKKEEGESPAGENNEEKVRSGGKEGAVEVNEHVLEGKSFDHLKEFLGDLYLEQDCKKRPSFSKEVERY